MYRPWNVLFVLAFFCVWSCGKTRHGNSPTPTDGGGGPTVPADKVATTSTKTTATGGYYILEWRWTSPVIALGSVSAQFTLNLPDSSVPRTVTEIDIDPWMPSMGHGTYRGDQKITAVDPALGIFKVDGLFFTMGGPWELRIAATVNGTKDRALVSVDVP